MGERVMKIIVIGATGTIGAKVTQALAANGHEVVGVARSSREIRVNLDEPATVHAMFDKIRNADAVISCAGNAAFKPFAQLTDADYELGLAVS
jgi:nucleoside-diphosphate-sugar epimerase